LSKPCACAGRHFAREIAAYDVQTRRCDVYGQDARYDERVMLVYDGLHYDALAVAGARAFACAAARPGRVQPWHSCWHPRILAYQVAFVCCTPGA
jgi:hypothetical protein